LFNILDLEFAHSLSLCRASYDSVIERPLVELLEKCKHSITPGIFVYYGQLWLVFLGF
jgi:hypothetical protein